MELNYVTTVRWRCRCPSLQEVDGDSSRIIEHSHLSCTCGWLHLIPVPVTKDKFDDAVKAHARSHDNRACR